MSIAGHVNTLEDFEGGADSFTATDTAAPAVETGLEHVHNGRQSLKMTYNASSGSASLGAALAIPAGESWLGMWVYGDGSGNTLMATVTDSQLRTSQMFLTALDFTGWRYVSAELPEGAAYLNSLDVVYGGGAASGALWLDQLTTANENVSDAAVPTVTLTVSGAQLTARVSDNVDRTIPQGNVSLTYDGAALPVAGGYAARRERTPRADSAERTARREKIMTNIALACTILTILVSVVFVFLIGAAFGVSTGGVSAGAAVRYNIFYFFGTAYDLLPESDDDFMLQVGTTGTAFGTVCSVVGLVSVVACAVWSVVRICNVLTGRTDKGVLAPAAATYFAFLCAAMLFFLCIAQNVTTAGVSTGLVMNGATIAGIVLGAVFLLAAVVLSALMWGTGSDKRRFAFRLTAGVLCTACAVTVIALLCGGAVGYAGRGSILTCYYNKELCGRPYFEAGNAVLDITPVTGEELCSTSPSSAFSVYEGEREGWLAYPRLNGVRGRENLLVEWDDHLVGSDLIALVNGGEKTVAARQGATLPSLQKAGYSSGDFRGRQRRYLPLFAL